MMVNLLVLESEQQAMKNTSNMRCIPVLSDQGKLELTCID